MTKSLHFSFKCIAGEEVGVSLCDAFTLISFHSFRAFPRCWARHGDGGKGAEGQPVWQRCHINKKKHFYVKIRAAQLSEIRVFAKKRISVRKNRKIFQSPQSVILQRVMRFPVFGSGFFPSHSI